MTSNWIHFEKHDSCSHYGAKCTLQKSVIAYPSILNYILIAATLTEAQEFPIRARIHLISSLVVYDNIRKFNS